MKSKLTENGKALAFIAFTLSLITTGLNLQKATVRTREKYDEAAVVSAIQAITIKRRRFHELLY